MTANQRPADPEVRYLVEVRPPRKGEKFITSGTIRVAHRDYRQHTAHPVIIKTVKDKETQ